MFKRISHNAKQRLIAKGRKIARSEFQKRLKDINKENRKTIIEIKKSHTEEIKEILRDSANQIERTKKVRAEMIKETEILRQRIQEAQDIIDNVRSESHETKYLKDNMNRLAAQLAGKKETYRTEDNRLFTLKKKANL